MASRPHRDAPGVAPQLGNLTERTEQNGSIWPPPCLPVATSRGLAPTSFFFPCPVRMSKNQAHSPYSEPPTMMMQKPSVIQRWLGYHRSRLPVPVVPPGQINVPSMHLFLSEGRRAPALALHITSRNRGWKVLMDQSGIPRQVLSKSIRVTVAFPRG